MPGSRRLLARTLGFQSRKRGSIPLGSTKLVYTQAMEPKEALRKLWDRVCRPGSACPDIELAYLARTMADVLVESGYSVGSNKVANWVAAYVSVVGKSTVFNVETEWSDTVQEFTGKRDENGYLERRPYEEIELEREGKMVEARSAIEELLEKGVLIKSGNHLLLG